MVGNLTTENIMDLTIAVNGEYFDQIKAGTKTEEYRLCTPYWKKRMEQYYDRLILTRGYPKKTDTEKRMEFKWQGSAIRTITHPHFGRRNAEAQSGTRRAQRRSGRARRQSRALFSACRARRATSQVASTVSRMRNAIPAMPSGSGGSFPARIGARSRTDANV